MESIKGSGDMARNSWVENLDWKSIESRLRKLGAPDVMFDADFDSRVENAVAAFTQIQEQRVADGLETQPLPDDPRALVPVKSPRWLHPVRYSLREWVMQPRRDAKAALARRAARERKTELDSTG